MSEVKFFFTFFKAHVGAPNSKGTVEFDLKSKIWNTLVYIHIDLVTCVRRYIVLGLLVHFSVSLSLCGPPPYGRQQYDKYFLPKTSSNDKRAFLCSHGRREKCQKSPLKMLCIQHFILAISKPCLSYHVSYLDFFPCLWFILWRDSIHHSSVAFSL